MKFLSIKYYFARFSPPSNRDGWFFKKNILPAAILTVILCLAMTKRKGMGQSGATPAWDSARRKNRFNSALQFVKMQPCLPAPEVVSCREWGGGGPFCSWMGMLVLHSEPQSPDEMPRRVEGWMATAVCLASHLPPWRASGHPPYPLAKRKLRSCCPE